MNVFYYGIWVAGILGAVSLLAVSVSYRGTVRDISHLPHPRGKWMKKFCQDYQQLLKERTQIQNPAIFISKRIKERKIGFISLHRMKNMLWYAIAVCLTCMGVDLFLADRAGEWTINNPWTRSGTILTGLGISAGLLILRAVLAISYQEEMIEDGLLDYLENEGMESGKILSLEVQKSQMESKTVKSAPNQAVQGKAIKTRPMKNSHKKGKASESKKTADSSAAVKNSAQGIHELPTKNVENKSSADKPAGDSKNAAAADKNSNPEKSKNNESEKKVQSDAAEQAYEQISKGIQESAATANKYGHLLSKEEEAIVKEVIQEFLT